MTDPLFLDYLLLSSPIGFLDGLPLTHHTPQPYGIGRGGEAEGGHTHRRRGRGSGSEEGLPSHNTAIPAYTDAVNCENSMYPPNECFDVLNNMSDKQMADLQQLCGVEVQASKKRRRGDK
ncbi:hypothetical protein KIPB_008751 [Kipferlia bialata]|uniref:Uncharacterized protein n=1 Tax=Kipferlia bialata TaxID=797122 RepID=A0A9K3D247_9EUKA|nr:hypothetical protein KIPB_008751 [Kipferlia bialata]|eukprot:g8751.t1